MTLDEFIAQSSIRNSYVEEEGFSSLYVRIGPRYINGKKYNRVLDLANFEASDYGKGTFTNLVTRLRDTYPDLPLFVESVLNPRLPNKLLSLGFTYVPNSNPPCFILGI